jgi:hypothetical protein
MRLARIVIPHIFTSRYRRAPYEDESSTTEVAGRRENSGGREILIERRPSAAFVGNVKNSMPNFTSN